MKFLILFHFTRPEIKFWFKFDLFNYWIDCFFENQGLFRTLYQQTDIITQQQYIYSCKNSLLKSILFYFDMVDHNQTPHMCGTCENLGEMTSFLCSRTDVPSRRGWTQRQSSKLTGPQIYRTNQVTLKHEPILIQVTKYTVPFRKYIG